MILHVIVVLMLCPIFAELLSNIDCLLFAWRVLMQSEAYDWVCGVFTFFFIVKTPEQLRIEW